MSFGTDCGAGSAIVNEVARIVGGEDETSVETQALDCINRVIQEMTMHDWRFLKTNATDITLVDGTATYTLATGTKSASYAQLVDSAGRQDHELTYVPDDTMTHWITDRETKGRPYYYSLRNLFADGKIDLYPIPDAGAASTWKLDVEYYKRITAATNSATVVDLPEEARPLLVTGGQMYLLEEREKNSPVLPIKIAEYGRLFGELRASDRRVTDETARFRLGRQRPVVGTTYIRIS